MLNDVDADTVAIASQFYARYKSACHGITRREELQRLFEDTYLSWANPAYVKDNYTFSRVLFALCRHLHVCRVVKGTVIAWSVFTKDREKVNEKDRQQVTQVPSVQQLQDMFDAQSTIVNQLIKHLHK